MGRLLLPLRDRAKFAVTLLPSDRRIPGTWLFEREGSQLGTDLRYLLLDAWSK
ncbi:MAG: hypothetical protein H7Y37_01220 [Anaerolineae bacterium]|nr:hypothetical protein [Gloeobacterales cyanobacterium ES-bin-313]